MAKSTAPSTKALGKRKQQEAEAEPEDTLGNLSLSEGEDFPEIDLGSEGSAEEESEEDSDVDDDEDEDEDEDEEALMLAERLEEEQLERELREEEEDEADSSEIDSQASLTDLIERYSGKPSAEVDTPGTSVDGKDSALLGFDTRQYQHKRRTVKSDITGEDKFEWDPIEPIYDSADSGGEDVRFSLFSVLDRSQLTTLFFFLSFYCRLKTALEMFQAISMKTCPTSDTIWTAKKS